MRRALVLLALVPVLSVLALPSATLAVTGDQAHGAGTFEWASCVPGSAATFEFDATGLPTGMAAVGAFSFGCTPVATNPGGTFTATVSCLVLGANAGKPTAVLGGMITSSTYPGFTVGLALSFSVTDVGPAGMGDAIGDLRIGADCAFNVPPHALTTGDIVVTHVSEPPQSPATTVVLTPPTAINDVGTSHTVTATATTAAGSAASGVTVYFTVAGSVSTTGLCTTNGAGQCTFTYGGPQLPGADLITGCADANRNGLVDAGEPCGDATKVWMLPATTPGEVTGGGWIPKNGDKVFFGLNAGSDTLGGPAEGQCSVIDHATKTQIKCLSVDSVVVTPTHATFFGRATVDGAATNYRIDVDDLGEPGTNDTFKILTDSGYVAAGTLEAGNIQIHM